jgi:hypothetical protein
MVAAAQRTFDYQLDPQDTIEWVSEDWLAFARENGAAGLELKAVLGKQLWEFIADEPTRQLYRNVFTMVRATDQPKVVPFRCDSPTLRRFMRLEVRHRPSCGLDLKSILVRAEPCERQGLLDANTRLSNDRVTMCSCCKFLLIEPLGWLSLAEANRLQQLDREGKRPQVRYDVCPSCWLNAHQPSE